MKKLKWLLLLLVACCCIGCGKGEEAAKTGNDMVEESGEDISKDDEKEVDEKDDDEEGGKKEKEEKEDRKPTAKPVEKQPVPYAVTQSNKFEIDGTWYDETGTWELIFDVSAGTAFPSVAEGILTNGNVNATVFLDESNRESDSVIYPCYFDGSQFGAKLTFTEDGILLENHELLDKKVLFTRPEGYVKGAQVAGHAVTQNNLADIMGLWYDSNNEWNFFILPCNDGQFPNVGTGVLTNGAQNILLCLDEKGRKSDSVIQACNENGMMYNTLVNFTKDGIKVDGIPEIGFAETMFERKGMYQGTPIGSTSYYNMEEVAYKVVHQMIGNGKTYYLLEDAYNGEYAISYEDKVNYNSYEGYFFYADTAVSYYDQMLMGFSLVQLNNYMVYTEDEFYYYVFGDGPYEGSDDDTPVCDFPDEYDVAFYDEDLDLWVVAYTTLNRQPFEMTSLEYLKWEANQIGFIGKLKNNGSTGYCVAFEVSFCNRYGEVVDTGVAMSRYFPEGYEIDTDYEIEGVNNNDEDFIPAGEEGIFAFTPDGYDIYAEGPVGYFDEEIHYLYFVAKKAIPEW